MRILLLLYCLLVIYGSFLPFHLSIDEVRIHSQFLNVQLLPYQAGVKNFSTPDLVSNFFLFIPFGFLVMGAGSRRNCSRWSNAVIIGICGFLFGLAIEAGQLFTRDRISSPLDAMSNGLGALTGGFLGDVFFRTVFGRFKVIVVTFLRERPGMIPLALVLLVFMANAFFPFEPTLDVFTVWQNLKKAHWIPFREGTPRLIGDLVVEKILLFALLGNLVHRTIGHQRFTLSSVINSLLLTMLFILPIEGLKVFFVGRTFNSENLILGLLGGLMGIIFLPLITRIPLIRRRTETRNYCGVGPHKVPDM